MSSGFNIDPDTVDGVAEQMFELSEELYNDMKAVVDDADGLDGAADTDEFTGVAEVIEAVEKWDEEFIPTHRHEIEEFAGYLVVAVRETVELDSYVSTAFDQYADEFPRTEGVPEPELPTPDPADAVPVMGGEDVAVP